MDKPSKPSIPKGTRDFSPEVMVKRNYIFDIIKEVFCLFGYKPIETPSIENLKTLLGKYGEEGDRLIFKILNSGNFLQDVDSTKLGQFTEENARKLIPFISEKALRYDLTVPFARYVVQNQNEITFPFKRYQIQPVWRADRPQKGRYREFYQCDVDVIGSNSLLNELELIQIIDKVFTKLKLTDFTVKLNNRKILTGISEVIGQPDKLTDITVAIDKIDKIGIENVNKELEEKGINKDSIAKLQGFLNIKGTNKEKLNLLRQQFTKTEVGLKGVEELETIFSYIDKTEIDKNKIQIDISLARGLNYYTGAIFEVKANNVSIGSICGGGRYDDLTGIFGLPDVSGVGISFGADRIYDVMTELNLFPESVQSITKVLFINFGNIEAAHCLALINKVRNAGINAELYPEDAKLKKQMNYADKNKIPFVIIAGSNEIEQKKYTLKNMTDGMQEQLSIEEIIKKVK